jgi:hypothetical protein
VESLPMKSASGSPSVDQKYDSRKSWKRMPIGKSCVSEWAVSYTRRRNRIRLIVFPSTRPLQSVRFSSIPDSKPVARLPGEQFGRIPRTERFSRKRFETPGAVCLHDTIPSSPEKLCDRVQASQLLFKYVTRQHC